MGGSECSVFPLAEDQGGVGGIHVGRVEMLQGESAVSAGVGMADGAVFLDHLVLLRGGHEIGRENGGAGHQKAVRNGVSMVILWMLRRAGGAVSS